MHIGVTGIIGAGKSTLIETLAEDHGYKTYFEPVEDNPYLQDFYDKPERYAALMQLRILSRKFDQQRQAARSSEDEDVLQDCPMQGDYVFARVQHQNGFMSDRDFETYQQHYRNYRDLIGVPDVVLYLDVCPEESLQRIDQRGRDGEDAIDEDYLKQLRSTYRAKIDELDDRTTVVRMDWNSFKPAETVHERLQSVTDRLAEPAHS